ncbi:predicted protein [Sclerotinia sclerotiorum 1980 UF-70]|uniref:Uncharacterized protein n=1 Tax=Sclerotinia sclerotiorum (strain ATCC 18683 / 1980 / Ss-1) TaxID=665079 RepID=A7F6L6_SCLS1|nr:predicted protein [Sclerotinia sclerotiorum 1980 UF-70]EDN98387.1 predicted protein [Sclerotinia sclerotiorum 1980 UF-70]
MRSSKKLSFAPLPVSQPFPVSTASRRAFTSVNYAVGELTALRRVLEGPDGYHYQYRGWYYQVIGNNPRSTDTFFAAAEVASKNKERDAWGLVNEAESLVAHMEY